jgi:hypothetical protein
MPGYPCCCDTGRTCFHCCSDARDEYVIDFGAGGLTDDNCDFCDQIAGEFTVRFDDSFTWICAWSYRENDVCTDDCHGYQGCGDEEDFTFLILLHLEGVPFTTKCKWVLEVSLSNTGVEPDCDCCSGGSAEYESAQFERGTCKNQPVSLTKQSENFDCGGSTATNIFAACGGALPGTITLKAP